MLDIHTNPKNPVIGDRALAENAEDVGAARRRDRPRAAGRTASPPAASIFPGMATPSVDSHLELPLVEHPPDRIRRVEFVPFRAAIDAGVAFIMTAHVLVPSLDEQRPATLSPTIVAACCATSSISTASSSATISR